MALGLDSSQIVKGNPSTWPSLGVTHRDLTMSSSQIEAALSIEVPGQREGISSALKDLAGFLECCHAPADDVRYSVVQAVLS
jgi:hypothetical protein